MLCNISNVKRGLQISLASSKTGARSTVQKRHIHQFERKLISRLYNEDAVLKRLSPRGGSSMAYFVARAGFNSLSMMDLFSELFRSGEEDDDGT